MTLEKKTDEELVKLLQEGNQEAFPILYDRYAKLIYYVSYQMCKCKADAEEIVQEVFTKLFHSIQEIKDPKRVKFWLTTVAHNECIHLFRSNKDQSFDEQKLQKLYLQKEQRKEFIPTEHVRYESDMDVLRSCIGNLSDEQREVITLKYFAQLSIDEIAEILHIPEGTVKSRLAYAKKKLRVDVETYCQANQLPLTFRLETIGAMLPILMHQDLKSFLSKPQNPTPMQIPKNTSTLFTSAIAKATVAISLCAGIGLVGVYVYENMPSEMLNTTIPNEHQSISYKGTAVHNAKEAYQILKTWAHCDYELKQKTIGEKEAIRPVYNMLKEHDNQYYVMLERYWKEAFE